MTLPPGTAAIAAGLAILAAAMLSPGVPAVTAISLVILGATSATMTRLRGHAAFLPILTAHAFVYGSLYALFVGSALHAAANQVKAWHALASSISRSASARWHLHWNECGGN